MFPAKNSGKRCLEPCFPPDRRVSVFICKVMFPENIDILYYAYKSLCGFIHAHKFMHTSINSHTYTCTHNSPDIIQTYMHIYIHTCTHTYMHTHILYKCMHSCTFFHSFIDSFIHLHYCTHIHTYIHTYTHTCIRTFTHSFMHTYILTYIHTYIHTGGMRRQR